MEDKTSIEYLYTMVARDANIIIEIISDKSLTDKASKEKRQKELENYFKKLSIKELLDNCVKFLNNPAIIKAAKGSYPKIYESLIKYLDGINELLEQKLKNKDFPTLQANEYDIYRAYSLLCGIRFIFIKSEEVEFSKFNYKEFTFFAEFLDIYGNSKNLARNYEKNFLEFKDKKQIKLELINNWIYRINESNLSPMTKNSKKRKKKVTKKKKQIMRLLTEKII